MKLSHFFLQHMIYFDKSIVSRICDGGDDKRYKVECVQTIVIVNKTIRFNLISFYLIFVRIKRKRSSKKYVWGSAS